MLNQSTAGSLAGHTPSDDLVFERLPGGSYAWLRPELNAAIRDADQVDQALSRRLGRCADQPPEPRYWITDAGRRALDEDRRARAMEALFGQPWPTVAEASRLEGVA
jgi:hypothetical protein